MDIKAFINGTEYKALRDFTISEQAGNKTSSEISVLVEDQPVPLAGDIIELIDGTETLFWGMCGIPKSPKYKTGLEPRLYKITCGNSNSILSHRIINVAYQDHTISEIVQALFDDYIAAEGITVGEISTIDVSLDVYTAKDYNLQDALNELADLVSATWRVDSDKSFHFVVADDFPQFPVAISEDWGWIGELQHTTKDYSVRTVQYISGAKDKTTPQTEAFIYDGDNNAFEVSFGVSSRPTISINGTAVDPSLIGVNGLDNIEDCWFMFSYESRTITYNSSSEALSTGDTVTIVYTGLFPIRIRLTNESAVSRLAAATGLSGLRENVKLASNVTTQADAVQLAQSLLEQFETCENMVKFWMTSRQLYALGLDLEDTKTLTRVQIDLPRLGIEGEYIITERKLTPLLADPENAKEGLKVQLTLRDRNYLRSYGEILSNLRKDLVALTVREDDIVTIMSSFTERLQLSEAYIYSRSMPFFPSTTAAIFAPLDFGETFPV